MVEQREDGWWVILDGIDDCGPYDTQKDAKGSERRIEQFLKNEDDESFFTGE